MAGWDWPGAGPGPWGIGCKTNPSVGLAKKSPARAWAVLSCAQASREQDLLSVGWVNICDVWDHLYTK